MFASRSALKLLFAGLLSLLFLLAYELKVSHDLALSRVNDNAQNLALTLEGQLESTFRRIESSMSNIAGQLPAGALQLDNVAAYRERVDRVLMPFMKEFPEVGSFYVWDAEGNSLYGAVPEAMMRERRSIAHRPGFQALRANPSVGIVYSDLIQGVISRQQTVVAYFPVRDGAGKLKAVITGSLNLEHFGRVFKRLNLTKGSVVFIRRSDNHKLVIRYPVRESDLNLPIRNRIQERIDAGELTGRDRFKAVTDGEYRIYAFRKLTGVPFYIVVGLAEASALEAWHTNLYLTVTLTLFTVVLLGGLFLRMRGVEAKQRQAQADASQAHLLLQESINSIETGLVVFDASDRLVVANQGLCMIQNGLSDLIQPGRTFSEISREGAERGLFELGDETPQTWLSRLMARHQQADGQPFEIQLTDGRWILMSEHRTPSGYTVGVRTDITERKRLEARLHELATRDALTGLPNRREAMRLLAEELMRVQRDMSAASVLMLDVDHFKRINDTYGHAGGDSALKFCAQQISARLRAIDTCSRLGGEEFAVLLPGTDLGGARVIAERLRASLEAATMELDGQPLRMTVSIGAAQLRPTDADADAALRRADAALYRAKSEGRNRVVTETSNVPL
jgi:diguanylate cyclase (GGDEF)-like protein